jgi:hypothetical protein
MIDECNDGHAVHIDFLARNFFVSSTSVSCIESDRFAIDVSRFIRLVSARLSICLVSRREVKHLLPSTVLKLKSVRPQVWTTTVHEKLDGSVEAMTHIEAKIQFLSSIYSRRASLVVNPLLF